MNGQEHAIYLVPCASGKSAVRAPARDLYRSALFRKMRAIVDELWGRLSQHRGSASSGAGNHRGSIFRLLVGSAIKARAGSSEPPSWGIDSGAGAAARRLGMDRTTLRQSEAGLERRVTRLIGAMPFLWLEVDDPPGPGSDRDYVERNAIALLSNFRKDAVDTPSPEWLGRHSDRERVRESGLWNNNHVDGTCAPGFCDRLDRLIAGAKA